MKTLYQGYADYKTNPKIYLEKIEFADAHRFSDGFAKIDLDELDELDDEFDPKNYVLAKRVSEDSQSSAEYYFYRNDEIDEIRLLGLLRQEMRLKESEELFKKLQGQEYLLYWSVSLSDEVTQLRSDVQELKALLTSSPRP